jgi:ATPase subunit of ABC transporter with duplicated ATPase domains
MFTQDLAQELNVNARAVDLVLQHAREGNTALTEQEARAVMGRLGLSDEKALRLVGDLSGGEKARVALSMFGLKPNNLLVLDEPRCVRWKTNVMSCAGLYVCSLMLYFRLKQQSLGY